MKLLKNAFSKLNKDSRGFTLVELICTIAILAIAGVAIGMFVSFSTRTYKDATYEIDLQYDAQQTVNQIKNMVMDANKGVGMFTPVDADPFFVIYNMGTDKDLSGNDKSAFHITKIRFDSANNSLMYGEASYIIPEDSDRDDILSTIDEDAIATGSVLCGNISGFFVDTADLDNSNSIKLEISFAHGEATYEAANTVMLRNRVHSSDSARAAYNNVAVERNKYITSVNINKVNGTEVTEGSLPGGGTGKVFYVKRPLTVGEGPNYDMYSFQAIVNAYGMSDAKRWELTGGLPKASGGSYVNPDTGEVYISSLENQHELTLTAISNADDTQTDEMMIYVKWIATDRIDWKEPSTHISTEMISQNKYKTNEFFEFGLTNDDIKYTENVSELLPSEVGFTWEVYSDDLSRVYGPEDGFYFNKTTGELKCDYRASDKFFKIVVNANCPKENGDTYSEVHRYQVEKLSDGTNNQTYITWDRNGGELLRNGSKTLSVSPSGFTASSYDWSIVYVDESAGWTGADKSNISLEPNHAAGTTVKISEDLDPKKSFKFMVHVKVNGTVGSNKVPISFEETSNEYTVKDAPLTLNGDDFARELCRGESKTSWKANYNNKNVTNSCTWSLEWEGGSSTAISVNKGSNSATLNIDKNLDYDKNYKFRVKVQYKGLEVYSEWCTVPKVEVVITPQKNSKYTLTKYSTGCGYKYEGVIYFTYTCKGMLADNIQWQYSTDQNINSNTSWQNFSEGYQYYADGGGLEYSGSKQEIIYIRAGNYSNIEKFTAK